MKREKNKLMNRVIKLLIAALIGAIIGFAYYKLIGCRSGACPITSRWWSSSLYGAVMGLLVGSIWDNGV